MQKLFEKIESLFSKSNSISIEETVYVDLAPIDNADEKGIYTKALKFATDSKKIFNIALTGPYGSGKSSIINTFLKSYRKPTLKISLAAFASEHGLDNSKPDEVENESKITKQEIERSILQQILHGEKADKLIFSRFKKIKFPKWWSFFISLLITIGLLDFYYLSTQNSTILKGDFFKPFDFSNWFHFFSIGIGFCCLWGAFHFLYIKSFGLYIKSISMKEIGFSSDVADKESILNRHLDEIIYFFQVTNYELVVIEDLDRFKNPDIFVTLREINSLINANSGVKRTVRFLYALRDDMFVNTDRAKFFEFIIPVIPIINISNSIDKVWERVNKLSLKDKIDGEFIRDVSLYLNDLRLINNIFNEYSIYNESIENDASGSLGKKKLLAVLIYKNLLPSDFEELHRGKGYLAEILNRHNDLIAITEKKYKSRLSEIETQIVESEKQVPHDLYELRNIYAMALIEKAPQNSYSFDFNGINNYSINKLSSHREFDNIIEATYIVFRSQSEGHTRINISGFQNEVNPNKTFKQRKQEIENKPANFKESASKNISELRTKIASLRLAKFNEIMRENAKETEELFNKFGDNKELMKYLVFEGYIDDTYHQYTSLFHSGRLSHNDNKFLKRIRGFNNPEPDFQIDNPDEVIAEMRDTDFNQRYVLNIKLVDGLFENQSKYSEKISKLLEFVSNNFDKCEDFLSTYYATGKHVGKFIESLSIKWSGYVSSVISSNENLSHVGQMLACLTKDRLTELSRKNVMLSEFVSERLSEILALRIDFEPNKLKCLNLEIKDLSSVKAYDAVKALLIEEGLYQISIANVEFIFEDILGVTDLTDLKTKHYSTVLVSGNKKLIEKIEQDFEHYFETILLRLDSNSEEDAETIIKVINHEEIDTELLQEFLEEQSTKLQSLDDVPDNFHALLFNLQKIETSWTNCLAFLSSESFDEETLTTYLQKNDTKDILTKIVIERHNDKEYKLSSFLINNGKIDDDVYRDYVIAFDWKFTVFPKNLNIEKINILIEERKITFSADSMSFLDDNKELQVLFVARNIDKYFEMSDEITIDDDFREDLLRSDINDEHKLKIIEDMNLITISSLPNRTDLIVKVLARNLTRDVKLKAENVQAIIINAKSITEQILLFNKFHSILSYEQVLEVIKKLPDPFCKIESGWSSPRIDTTSENINFVRWLKDRRFISSWSQNWLKIRINTYRR